MTREKYKSAYQQGYSDAMHDFRDKPQKSGKWLVDLQTSTEDYYVCSECGRRIHLLYSDVIGNYRFCPYCGAEMVKESSDADSD